MDQTIIDIVACHHGHLDDAHRLSREAGWPHRREDWAMMLSLSQGVVAMHGTTVVGTALMTPFADEAATINMVVVDVTMRGRGLGRRLMDAALQACGARPCRLIATADGLPLYERLGFRATHEIRQHQGDVQAGNAAPTHDVAWAQASDGAAIAELDRQALGMDRGVLLRLLREAGRIAVLREGGRLLGYGALRRFGRGEVIGPVIAHEQEQAKAILSFLMKARAGGFLRVDTPVLAGLSPWLAARGLVPVGGGVAMLKGQAGAKQTGPAKPFALASQALG